MGDPTPRHRPQTILYVAATDDAAQNGATALERVATGPDRAVRPTTSVDRVRSWASNVDCVVFAETPTTPAGAHLLDVVDACGETPLVLFTDTAYAATAARSTDGIDGYVRRDTDEAVAHLADEITWVCDGDSETGATATANASGQPSSAVLEATAEMADCHDRDRLLDLLVEATAERPGFDRCWVSTVNFGELVPRTTGPSVSLESVDSTPTDGPLGEAFRADEPLRIADLAETDTTDDDSAGGSIDPPIENARSLCSVPIADLGVLQVAAETPDEFDDADVRLLTALCASASAALDRDRAETRLAAERDRLQRERDELAAERDRLAEEQTVIGAAAEQLAAERDLLREVFASVPAPAVRYEFEADTATPVVRDVTDAFEAVFGDDREAVVGEPVGEYTVPPGLADRATALTEALRSGERRELESRRETVDGVREFELTVVPLGRGGDGEGDEDADRDEIEVEAEAEAETPGSTEDRTAWATDASEERHSPAPAPASASAPVSAPTAHESAPTTETATTETTTAETATTGLLLYDDVTDDARRKRELTATARRLESIATLLDEEVQTPLNVARGYLELAEKTGDREHFEVIDDAHLQLVDHLEALYELAAADDVLGETEPVAIHDVARRAWITVDTGDAELVTEENLVLEADRTRLRELFEYVLQTAVERDERAEANDTESSSITITVGATTDGFYVARNGPTPADTEERSEDSDGTGDGVTLELVEGIADAHDWDLGVAADDDRTAFAFRGVDAIDSY